MICNSFSAKYDLKRCFKSLFIFPLIACVMFCYLILTLTVYNEQEYVYSIFPQESATSLVGFRYLYAAVGIAVAVQAFRFLTSVKQCNVYLSMGISRKQLAQNRIFASVFYIALASILPMVVALIKNKIDFTVTTDLWQACGYYSLSYFMSMLLGFAVGSLIMVKTGNFIEGGIYSGIILLTPAIVNLFLQCFLTNTLNGFVSKEYIDSRLDAYGTQSFLSLSFLQPLEQFSSNIYLSYRLGDDPINEVDIPNLMFVLLWLVIAGLMLIPVIKLLQKRKAEVTQSIGADKKAVCLVSGVLAFAAFGLASELYAVNRAVGIICGLIAPATVFIAVVAIIFRNKADIKKYLKGSFIVCGVSAVCTVLCLTGFFGAYYKAPNVEDVEYVSLMPSGYENFWSESPADDGLKISDVFYSDITDKKDIEKVISIQNTVTENLNKGDNHIAFVYKLKSGKMITKSFKNVSDEGARESFKIIETDYYKSFIIKSLNDKDFDYDVESEKLKKIGDAETERERLDLIEKHGNLYRYAEYALGEVQLYSKDLSSCVLLKDIMSTEEIYEFKKVFGEEFTSLSVDEMFYPKQQAVYHLSFNYGEEEEGNDSPVNKSIPIYPQMKKTLQLLQKYNISLSVKSIDEIECVYIKKIGDIIQQSEVTKVLRLDKTFSAQYIHVDYKQENYGEVVDAQTGLVMYTNNSLQYSENEKVTEKNEIKKYLSQFKTTYSFVDDDGYVIKFMFKDGSDLLAYLPQEK